MEGKWHFTAKMKWIPHKLLKVTEVNSDNLNSAVIQRNWICNLKNFLTKKNPSLDGFSCKS